MPSTLAQRIEDTLRPVIGSVLATVSVDVEARRLGKTTDTIDPSDIDAIAANLVSALRLVVGEDLAQAAAARVRGLQT